MAKLISQRYVLGYYGEPIAENKVVLSVNIVYRNLSLDVKTYSINHFDVHYLAIDKLAHHIAGDYEFYTIEGLLEYAVSICHKAFPDFTEV